MDNKLEKTLRLKAAQLEKELAGKNRELEIEAALERVRARAMAMQSSGELADLVAVLFNELSKLHITFTRCMIWLMEDDTSSAEVWMADPIADKAFSSRMKFLDIAYHKAFVKAWRERKQQWVYELKGEEKRVLNDLVFSMPGTANTPEEIKQAMIASEGVTLSFSFNNFGGLQVDGDEALSSDNLEILSRFSKVFDQTYTRFSDLQKSEAQAREAQIELALERVRARTMAMQHSEELAETAYILFQQFKELGENPDQATIGIINEEEHVIEYWVTMYGSQINKVFKFSIDEPNVTHKIYKGWKAKKKSLVIDLSGKSLLDFATYRQSMGGAKLNKGEKRRVINVAFFSKGIINVQSNEERSEESIRLLERFAGVFEGTYTRFLDLKKAEAQFREARVEAALEKVRSRSLAMHKADEIQEVVNLVLEKLQEMGIAMDSAIISIPDEKTRSQMIWIGVNGIPYPKPVLLPDNDDPISASGWQAWFSRVGYFARAYSFDEKNQFYNWAFEHSALKYMPAERKSWVMQSEGVGYSIAFGKVSAVWVVSYSGKLLDAKEAEILKRFALVFEQVYIRFLDLQKAEEQARESQIQLALERVRARTMAMQHSNELPETANLLFKQVQELGMPAWSAGYCNWTDNKKAITLWMSSEGVLQPPFNAPATKDASFIHMREAAERGETFYVEEVGGKALVKHYQYMRTLPVVGEVLDSIINAGHPLPTFQIFHLAYFTQGFLLFITYEPVPEAHDIFKRFAAVFEQTYTRFLDLQRAEEQARESQIQLGLERVRARAMAMQSSDELAELVDIVFKELNRFDFGLTHCAIAIADADSAGVTLWQANAEPDQPPISFYRKSIDHPYPIAAYKEWKKRTPKWAYHLQGAEKKAMHDYYERSHDTMNVPHAVKAGMASFDSIILSHSFNNFGYLRTDTVNPLSEENLDIVYRFARVFDLCYTRFNDIKQAEAQARESQIQLALERVRARTMAMQRSEELHGVIQLVFDQFQQLNFDIDVANFALNYKETDDFDLFLAVPHGEYPMKVHVPYLSHPVFDRFNEAKKKEGLLTDALSKNEKDSFFRHFFKYMPGVPEENKAAIFSRPGFVRSTAMMKNTALTIHNYNGIPYSEAENNILLRFGHVFEQTYTRFADLKQAEAQAREAQIQLGLERVRAKAMAMQTSEQLNELIGTVFSELTKLDFVLTRCLIMIFDPETKASRWWMANSEAPAEPMNYLVQNHKNPAYDSYLKAWKERDLKWKYALKGKVKKDWDDFLFVDTELAQLPGPVIEGMKAPEQVLLSASFNNFGCLTLVTLEPLSDEHSDIMLRFAKVFDMCYTRFNDLKQAEEQARESQIQLALERVRARTMAMQKSGELPETSALLFQQVKELGEAAVQNSIAIVNEKAGFVELSTTVHGSHELHTLHVPIDDPYVMAKAVAAWKANCKSLTLAFKGQELKDYNILRNSFLETKIDFPEDLWVVHISFFSTGWLSFSFNKHVPDELIAAQKRFAAVFDQTYTRFLDLEKAEAQAREAQIEAALERVRSKTMAMHNSADVGETVILMFNELIKLGVDKIARCGIAIPDNTGLIELWTARLSKDEKEEIIIGHIDTSIHPMLALLYSAWKSKQAHFEYTLEGDDLTNYITALNNYRGYPIKYDMGAWGSKQYHNDFFFHEGMVFAFTSQPLSAEISAVFNRFAGVFGQTYRRYLDLQKAEAQVREAQIEAALERTRTQSMIMQHSTELDDTLRVFHEQVLHLGINSAFSFLWLPDEEKDRHIFWAAWAEDNSKVFKSKAIDYPLDRNEPATAQCLIDWKGSDPVVSYHVPSEGVEGYFTAWQELIDGVESLRPTYFKEGLYYVEAFMKHGCFGVVVKDPLSDEEKKILGRLAIEFERTYTRFLDLQKAEAQAREAQIEAALERVRSKAMAMRSSDDLNATANTVFVELRKLGVDLVRCGVGLLEKQSHISVIHAATDSAEGASLELLGNLHMDAHPILVGIYKHWRQNEDYFPVLEGNSLKDYYKRLQEDGIPVPELKSNEKQLGYFFPFADGVLYAWSGKQESELTIKTLKRFTSVIGLTYTRYIELQNAELNTKEAVKQASLDRVRAEIASMRKRSDLERITPLIWNELTILGIPFIRCGVFIMDEEEKLIHTFLSTPDGKAIGAFHVPFNTSGNFEKMVDSWRHSVPYIDHWKEEAFSQFADTLVKQGAIASKAQYMRTLPHEGIHLNFLPFLQGMLYVGNSSPLAEDNINLIQAVADAFSTAYARYEDFNKLEAAKQQVDNTLTQLKATQTKLIQSEKMASLGELTAGIAHEIQNPLNFVNNFSEVSAELIDEMDEELDKGDIEEAKAIASDIKDNLQKIRHHGGRADGIVKGMLQHSRASSEVKEPTDLNKLSDEYLRLAYHGLRAKDKNFNAELVTHFDEKLPKPEVVPQDIGRVLINLYNNAFYATQQKAKTANGAYKPEVMVMTFVEDGQVIIRVKDNGNGIPENIKDKIMQPFFTTKPTGEGTGLGLSLSYDIIVKGHGGNIQVNSTDGEGSEFIIQLPVK